MQEDEKIKSLVASKTKKAETILRKRELLWLTHLGLLLGRLLELLLALHGGHDLDLRRHPLVALHVLLPLVQDAHAELNLVLLQVSEEEKGGEGFGVVPSQIH